MEGSRPFQVHKNWNMTGMLWPFRGGRRAHVLHPKGKIFLMDESDILITPPSPL